MNSIRIFFSRLLGLFRRTKLDREMDEEITAHLKMETERNVARGLSPDEARFAAQRAFGGTDQVKEAERDARSWTTFETLWRDISIALRTLRKSPGFTATVVLTLALGIGANAAIFSLLDKVLLRSLPVAHPEQLITLSHNGPYYGSNRGSGTFSYPMYRELEKAKQVFDGIIASYVTEANVAYAGTTERAIVMLASGNTFETLGIGTALGRPIQPEDDITPGAHPVIVLSHDYWQRRFGGDPRVLYQTITINQTLFTVIGVAPVGFRSMRFGATFDLMVPLMMKAQVTPSWNDLDRSRSLWLELVGRLKHGVKLEQAAVALTTLYQGVLAEEVKAISTLSQKDREWFVKCPIILTPGGTGQSYTSESLRAPLFAQMGMVGLVLLIACANVASLVTARSLARRRGIVIRRALGASRWRIVRQMLVESLLLALAGGLAGFWIAYVFVGPVAGLLPNADVARAIDPTPDVRVFIFALLAAAGTGLLFGIGPALFATRAAAPMTLRDESVNIAGGRALRRLFHSLVVAQMALSLVLLISCALFAASLHRLRTADLGFPTERLVSFRTDPGSAGYKTGEFTASLLLRLQQRLMQIPGVRYASFSSSGILRGWNWTNTVKFEGSEEMTSPSCDQIGPGYFATMGIPILLGREFSDQDRSGRASVCIINETLAQKYFPGKSPIGQHIYFGIDAKGVPDVEIVGVVKTVRVNSVREERPAFTYRPLLQNADNSEVTCYLRTTVDPAATANMVRGAVQGEDHNLSAYGLVSAEEEKERLFSGDRMLAYLATAFGVLATLLAALGLYGAVSYTVIRRTREIGVRVALGADQANILRLILRDVVLVIAGAIAIAIPVAYGAEQFIKSMLYGLSGFEATFALLATGILALVALAAGLIPARRATRVNPVEALRME